VWYGLLAGSVGSLFGVVIGVICALNLTEVNKIDVAGEEFMPNQVFDAVDD
jgi:lipoprotein-releasing system permease protein